MTRSLHIVKVSSSSSITRLSSTCETADDDDDAQANSRRQHQASTRVRFHEDMRRVLEARRHNLGMDNYVDKRRQRPPTLLTDLDGAERAYTMLQHLREIGMADEESYQIVMEAFLRRGRLRWRNGETDVVVCAADILCELLDDLLADAEAAATTKEAATETTAVEISQDSYNLALRALAVCATPRGERDYAQRAHALLRKMEAKFGAEHVQLDSYMHVIHAYSWQQANLKGGECAQQAHDLLDVVMVRTDDSSLLMEACNWVLEAYSKSGARDSADKAQLLFDRLRSMNQTVHDELPRQFLDAETFCNVILAWAKSSDKAGAQHADKLLHEMIDCYMVGAFQAESEPALIAFNGVISAWAKQGNAAKAENVLLEMNRVRPHCANLVPDAMSYNSVLFSHLKSQDKEGGLQNIIRLVQYMEDHHEDQPAIRPNSFTYNTLMKAWIQSRQSDMADQAEATLIKIESLWQQGDNSVVPDSRVYNMVINAYAKSNDQHAAGKALQILERMKSSSDSRYHPDVISYTSVIECLSKSVDPDAPIKATQLLREAADRYHTTDNPRIRPNQRTYTMAILTLARAHGSAVQASDLLQELIDLYDQTGDADLRPTEYAYNYVINCAANTKEDKHEAFQVATKTYQAMRKSDLVKPDSFTYAFWFKCCNNLLPFGDLRNKCVSYSFDECKDAGLVSAEVLKRLKQGLPSKVTATLLNMDPAALSRNIAVDLNDVPAEWTRHTKKRFSSQGWKR